MITDQNGDPLSTEEIIKQAEKVKARWQFVAWIVASCILLIVADMFGIRL